jgi:hypothetical protein
MVCAKILREQNIKHITSPLHRTSRTSPRIQYVAACCSSKTLSHHIVFKAIPTAKHGGNHTAEFAAAAATEAAHEETMKVSKALALLGFRVIDDDSFFSQVGHKCYVADKGNNIPLRPQVKSSYQKEF